MNISNLDPNLVAGIVTLLTAAAGFVWRKATGEKTRDLGELLDDAISAELEDAITDGETVATIENRLTKAGLDLAAKLGLKLSPYTLRIAVQWGIVEFRKRLQQRNREKAAADKVASQEALMVDAATKVPAAFAQPASPTVPKLEIDVEIVP
jgi:hypothetical protein